MGKKINQLFIFYSRVIFYQFHILKLIPQAVFSYTVYLFILCLFAISLNLVELTDVWFCFLLFGQNVGLIVTQYQVGHYW